jgi:hypothetical protein
MHQYTPVPANRTPTITVLDDSDAPNASNFDTPIENLADNLAFAIQSIATAPFNWQAALTTTGLPSAIAWDEFTQLWLVGTFSPGGTTHSHVFMCDGMDGTLLEIASQTSATDIPRGVAIDPVTGYRYFVENAFGLWSAAPAAGTWTNLSGGTGWLDVQCLYFPAGNKTIVAFGQSTHANTFLTSVTSATFTSGAIPGTKAVSTWRLAQNGTYALALSLQANPSVYKSTTGTPGSWTESDLTGVLGGTDVPFALAWGRDPGGPCWLMAVHVAGSLNHTAFWRSTDGVTWTATGATVTTQNFYDMAYVPGAGAWVGLVVFPGGFAPFGGAITANVIVSADGVTWKSTQGFMPSSVNAAPLPRIATSNTQAGVVDQAAVGGLRFSYCIGLPTLTLPP